MVNGTCPDRHLLHWQSQPMVRVWQLRIYYYPWLFYSMVLTPLVLCIVNLADVFNLAVFSERCFYRVQKEYLYAVMHTNYVRQQESMIDI